MTEQDRPFVPGREQLPPDPDSWPIETPPPPPGEDRPVEDEPEYREDGDAAEHPPDEPERDARERNP